MDIIDLEKKAISLGCKIIDKTEFSFMADCNNGIFFMKTPNSRLKVLLNSSKFDKISSILEPPQSLKPNQITIGQFNKQGPWSKILKLGNLDEVEYHFTDSDIEKIKDDDIKDSINRINRANKFSQYPSQDTIDAKKIVQEELNIVSNYLTKKIENKISETNIDILCGSKSQVEKSWSKLDKERYHYFIKINCKVPSLTQKMNEKIEDIGAWKTLSESDRFYIKSIIPPSKDMFLTGIKVVSPLGKSQIEMELIDENRIKKDKFIENILSINQEKELINPDTPIDESELINYKNS